ncbi:unnamed protein product, partial [marine sediment metagenome]
PVEYFESTNYTIIFKKGKIKDFFSLEQEVVAFLVIDKDERLEKYLHKTVFPLLDKLLKKFTSQFKGCNFTKTIQFETFKTTLNKLFGTGTLTFEEKVTSILA